MSTPIIDAHTHFWDPTKLKYHWLSSTPALNRPCLLNDYNEATEGIPIEKIVFVECNCISEQNEQEVLWVEEIAKQDPRIHAIVAYADMNDKDGIDANLERLMAHDMVRGIRHNIQFNEIGFAIQPQFVQGISKVLNLNRHFELCLTHDQMEECIELVSHLPERPLMLDHCGKPGIKSGAIEQWKKQLKKMSTFEHVYCKISGLLTEADLENWTDEDIFPYVDHVLDCFGIERIVYGGDWPISTLAGGYAAWNQFVQNWTDSWSPSEKKKYYYDNAAQFYKM